MIESIKIENPQQQFVPLERSETISWIGYVQRPINQKTQVRNVYLDSLIANKDFSLSSWPLTIISGLTFEKTGTYPRDNNDWQITIPKDWTYYLSIRATYSAATIEQWIRLVWIKNKNDEYLLAQYVVLPVASVPVIIQISDTFNLNKWEILKIDMSQSSTETLDCTVRLSIFKLS